MPYLFILNLQGVLNWREKTIFWTYTKNDIVEYVLDHDFQSSFLLCMRLTFKKWQTNNHEKLLFLLKQGFLK